VSDSNHPVADLLDAAAESEPRVNGSNVRLVDGGPAPVVLVGVVHDHPASVHRAEAIVETVEPETVAVELPDLLVPVIEDAADEDPVIAAEGAGGEMAAAMVAAEGAVVGIDVPGRGTGRSALTELRNERPSPSTVLRAVGDAGRIAAHALGGRLAGLGIPGTPAVEDLEQRHDYDLPADVTPESQADHERAHVRRSTTLLRSFDPPPATAFLDAVRERYMAGRLRSLRRNGSVVALVGYGHLDEVEAMLKNRTG
jgi:pheromone shutdown protein TraB